MNRKKLDQTEVFAEQFRAEFASLRDVPECQLSKERVRDAILNNDLKTRRSQRWAGWAVAPLAVLALGIMLTNRPEVMETSPQAGADFGSSSVVAQKDPLITEPERGFESTSVPPSPAMTLAQTESKVAATADQKVVRTNRKAKRNRAKAPAVYAMNMPAEPTTMSPKLQPAAAMPPTNRETDSGKPAEGPETVVASKPESNDPVVVIQNEPTRDTGASRAREVEANGQIVIGG